MGQDYVQYTAAPVEKLKKALVATVTVLVITTVSVVVQRFVSVVVQRFAGSEPVTGALDMSAAANRLNAMAPMMVDEVTELMNAVGFEDIFIYNYRLVNVDQETISANDLSRFIANDLRAGTTRQACSTPEMITLFEMGATLRYAYHYRDHTYISSFDVAPADCGL